MTKKVLELSLSCFLIVLAFAIITTLFAIKSTLEQYTSILEKQKQAQEEMVASAKQFEDVLFEVAFATTVLSLSEKDVIPGTAAEKMVGESIENIGKHSKRLAKLGEYINDYRLKQRKLPSSYAQ